MQLPAYQTPTACRRRHVLLGEHRPFRFLQRSCSSNPCLLSCSRLFTPPSAAVHHFTSLSDGMCLCPLTHSTKATIVILIPAWPLSNALLSHQCPRCRYKGHAIGVASSATLAAAMGARAVKTKKFMPAGGCRGKSSVVKHTYMKCCSIYSDTCH